MPESDKPIQLRGHHLRSLRLVDMPNKEIIQKLEEDMLKLYGRYCVNRHYRFLVRYKKEPELQIKLVREKDFICGKGRFKCPRMVTHCSGKVAADYDQMVIEEQYGFICGKIYTMRELAERVKKGAFSHLPLK